MPMELAFKSVKFILQSEARIIVNTKNKKIINYLLKNPITIGNTTDIAQKFDRYCYDGIAVKFKADIDACDFV